MLAGISVRLTLGTGGLYFFDGGKEGREPLNSFILGLEIRAISRVLDPWSASDQREYVCTKRSAETNSNHSEYSAQGGRGRNWKSDESEAASYNQTDQERVNVSHLHF